MPAAADDNADQMTTCHQLGLSVRHEGAQRMAAATLPIQSPANASATSQMIPSQRTAAHTSAIASTAAIKFDSEKRSLLMRKARHLMAPIEFGW